MDTRLVTVIIPCYNVGAYVEKAVVSILQQSFSNIEVLLVDDASTDNTLELCRSIKDARIKIIACSENTQKIGAVNKALTLASGDYIAFQDADDWSEPTRIEKQLNSFFNDPTLGICFTNYQYVGDKNEPGGSIALSDIELKDEFHHFGYKSNSGLNATVCATMMISKKVLEITMGYNEYFKGRVAEDAHWVYRILKDFKGIAVNEVLYHYNLRGDSLSGIQIAGKNVKAAYSWLLLGRIIYKDIYENINLLAPENKAALAAIELEACEEALKESLQNNIKLKAAYENSRSFKLVKKLISLLGMLGIRNHQC